MTNVPTCEEIRNEQGFEEISSESVDRWRWVAVDLMRSARNSLEAIVSADKTEVLLHPMVDDAHEHLCEALQLLSGYGE